MGFCKATERELDAMLGPKGLPPKSRSHLTGPAIVVSNRWQRQLCVWCGERLVDNDFTLVAVAGPWEPPAAFPPDKWVRVGGHNPTMYSVLDDTGEKYPEDACMGATEAMGSAKETK